VKGSSLNGGGELCGCRVDLRGGAKYSEVSQVALGRKGKLVWWEAGLDGQDVGGGAHEAIRRPSLDLVPEHRQLSTHVDGG